MLLAHLAALLLIRRLLSCRRLELFSWSPVCYLLAAGRIGRMRVCTIIATNYLAHARVLARSLARHHPGTTLTVLVVDADRDIDDRSEPFDLLTIDEVALSLTEFHRMAAIYDVTELSTAVKPWLLGALLRRGADVVCYLDPDIQVFAPLEHVEPLARRHGIVLIPHTTSPMPRDGLIPGEREILLAGAFNLGFIAVSRNTEPFLSWWSERLRRDCRSDVANAVFVDQRWIDFVPGYYDHAILTDPGYNVAYWNLYERELKTGPEGYSVNGRPLRFFHFSGFSALEPWRLSCFQGSPARIRLEDHPVLARLCHRYAKRLVEEGFLECVGRPYGFDRSAGDLPIDARVRRVYREELLRSDRDGTAPPPDPFDGAEADSFRDWIAPPLGREGPDRLSRYARAVWEERADLRAHFGSSDAGLDGYLDWLSRHGRTHAAVPPVFSPPPPRPPQRSLPTATREGVNVVGCLMAETRAEAERRREAFAKTYRRAYPKAVETLERDWARLVTFYDFPAGHWKHLRTTNVIESPFAAVRLRTDAAKRFKKVDNATALLWRLLMVAERRFRRLNAPEQLAAVYDGRKFEDGKLVKEKALKVAA